jgi:uncharacterized protein (TIRG00374 family)
VLGTLRALAARASRWLRLLVAVGILGILLSQIDLHAVAASLASLDRRYLLLALAAAVVSVVPAAWAWRVLLNAQDVRLSFVRIQLLYLIGLCFAAFTPGGLGSDVVRAVLIQRWTRQGVRAGVAIVASRLLSLLALALVVSLASLARPTAPTAPVAALVAVGAATLAVFGVERAFRRFGHLGRWPRFHAILSGVVEALGAFRHQPAVGARATWFLALYHVLGVLPIYLFAVGLGVQISLADAVALGLVIRLLAFLPISFNGLGISELGFVVLLSSVGVDAPQALAISILDRLASLVTPIIGGIAYGAGWGAPRS